MKFKLLFKNKRKSKQKRSFVSHEKQKEYDKEIDELIFLDEIDSDD